MFLMYTDALNVFLHAEIDFTGMNSGPATSDASSGSQQRNQMELRECERDSEPAMILPECKVNMNKSGRLSTSLNASFRQMCLCSALRGSAGGFQ